METKSNPSQQQPRQPRPIKKSSLLIDQLNLDKAPAFRLLKQNQLSIFIKEFLESFGGIETISFNENVGGFYPDIKFSFMSVVFIIEIDEFQHKRGLAYAEDREKRRLQCLKSTFKSLILIRINPDKSTDRPVPMISMFYNEVTREKEIIVNSGEAEYRYEEIGKLLRWVFFKLRQQQQQQIPFAEFRMFFNP